MLDLHLGEIDRLAQTAERFLTFARPRPADRRPLDLREVVRRVVSLVEAQARKEGVEAVFRPAGGAGERVSGDADQLTQLLLNVALNGVQAMAPHGGGTLTFSLGSAQQGGGSFTSCASPTPARPSRTSSSSGSSTPSSPPRTTDRPRARHRIAHRGPARGRSRGAEPPGRRRVEFSLSLPAA